MFRRKLSLILMICLIGASAIGLGALSFGLPIDRFIAGVGHQLGIDVPAHLIQTGERSTVDPTRISVYDGDMIEVDGQRMRLLDVEAPEIFDPHCKAEETRGYQARERLREMIASADNIEIVDSGKQNGNDQALIHLVIDGDDAGRRLMDEGLAMEGQPDHEAWFARLRHWCDF